MKIMLRPCMALVHIPRPAPPMSVRELLNLSSYLMWHWEGCPDEDAGDYCPDCGRNYVYCDCHPFFTMELE